MMASAPPPDSFDRQQQDAFGPPPSYDEAVSPFATLQQGPPFAPTPTPALAFGLNAVDFYCSSANGKYQSLINQANEWLKNNLTLGVRKCETLFLKSNAGIPETQKVTFRGSTFVKGLRLWLTPRLYPHPKPQQIACFSLVPNIVDNRSDVVAFEGFASLVRRLGDVLRQRPVNGHILTVESETAKVAKRTVASEDLLFTESGCTTTVLRIFYELGKPAYEAVDVIEFRPKSLEGRTPSGLPLYQTFPDLVQQVSEWCATKNIDVCNVETHPVKVDLGHETTYLRTIRVFTLRSTVPTSEPWPGNYVSGPLMSKTFLPVQLSEGVSFQHWQEAPTFETVQQTLNRINAWARENKVKIVSAETRPVHIAVGSEASEGPQTNVLTGHGDSEAFRLLVVRVYVDGVYDDPPAAMCPTAYAKWCRRSSTAAGAKESCAVC